MSKKIFKALQRLEVASKIKIMENNQFIDLKSNTIYKLIKVNKSICDECHNQKITYKIHYDNCPNCLEFCENCLLYSLDLQYYDFCGWSE